MNNFKILFLVAAIFNCSALAETNIRSLYNAGLNKCLRTTGILGTPLILGDCDYSDKAQWVFDEDFVSNCVKYYSKENPENCISLEGEIPTLEVCSDNTVVCFDKEKIFSSYNDMEGTESTPRCLSPSEGYPKQVSMKECIEDINNYWYANDDSVKYDVDVHFYNAYKNKCLRTTGLPDSTLTYGPCDNSEYTVWTIPNSHDGNFHSKINPDYCLSIEDGTVSLKECNDNTNLYRDVNFIKSPLFNNYCIGSSINDPNEISLKECNVNDQDQIWFFNIYDPSAVVIEEPIVAPEPEYVTIYFYNAYKNKCITSDGTSAVIGNCFFNDDALWELPVTHDGYYRSKAHPEKCLTVIDGVVTVSECNENTTLYRDGNFIRTPLSDNHCIGSAHEGLTLEYKENCIENHTDYIWYFNIWTPPETQPINDVPVPTETFNEIVFPTEFAEPVETEVIVPTAVAEEKPTMTIIKTVTAIQTEAY